MKIAYIHYHLKTGGVTTVIRQQVEALIAAGGQALILSGENPVKAFPADVIVIPGLGYDDPLALQYSIDEVAGAILDVLFSRWPQGPDVVHIHNPTLAKNRQMQKVLKKLQGAGLKLLCQIHDFAEDGRPAVYFQEPYVANCHYAVINQRDHHLLIQAGLNQHGCHLMPNTITPIHASPSTTSPDSPAAVLYPIRAIRRKNIGEAILISLFFKNDSPLAITLPPNSPQDIQVYNQWRKFVSRYDLRVEFEVGVKADFTALMGNCRYVLTTSITEGFGFAFLEAWSANKGLWGRLLPDICRGFIDAGIDLDHLYDHLWVPLEWMDSQALAYRWKSAMANASVQYGYPLSQGQILAGWDKVSSGGRIDFGLLAESFQKEVIVRVITDGTAFETLVRLNPCLLDPGPPEDSGPLIACNSDVVIRNYGPRNYMRLLMGIYNCVATTLVKQQIDKQILIQAFLSPENFSLLKWEPLHGY